MNESEYDFWITIEDLIEHFNVLYIAHQSSEAVVGIVGQLDSMLTPLLNGVYGNWVKDKTDGGGTK